VKKITLATIILSVMAALATNACATMTIVPIDTLLSHPERYNGKRICTRGMYASAFEVNALASSLRQEGSALYLGEPAIWLEGAEIVTTADCWEGAAAPAARFCEATVCGFFEHGARYGHLGGYEYQLSGTK
jgi:hypothetical protein